MFNAPKIGDHTQLLDKTMCNAWHHVYNYIQGGTPNAINLPFGDVFNTTHKMVMLGMVNILDLHGFTILLYNNCMYIYMCSKPSQQTIPASSNPHLLLVFVCEVKVHGSGGEFGCFFCGYLSSRAAPNLPMATWDWLRGW